MHVKQMKFIFRLGDSFFSKMSHYVSTSILKFEKILKSEKLLVPSISDKEYSACI